MLNEPNHAALHMQPIRTQQEAACLQALRSWRSVDILVDCLNQRGLGHYADDHVLLLAILQAFACAV